MSILSFLVIENIKYAIKSSPQLFLKLFPWTPGSQPGFTRTSPRKTSASSRRR
jgi:hypothetical protein